MSIKIARETDGRVSIALKGASVAVMSPVEARLIAIKLLLAAEELAAAEQRFES